MRRKGTITTWKDDQGYGFITSSGSGERVFFHISSLIGPRRPACHETVSYEVSTDGKGRTHAKNVSVIGSRDTVNHSSRETSLAVPVLFLIFLAGSVWVEN